MANISKRKVEVRVLETLNLQLIASIVGAKTRRDAHALVAELLTETERTILAKRFGIIAMLARNYSFEQIQELLKVSPDTVVRIWRQLRAGKLRCLTRYARNNPQKFEGESFMEELEKLLRAGMPPRGRGRNAFIKRMLRESEYYG